MTLIELIAAITIAGLVLLGAVLLLQSVDGTAMRLAREAEAATMTTMATSDLREMLAAAFATFDTTQRFEGDEQAATFSTRCPSPAGWFAACRGDIAIEESRDSALLRTRLADAPWRTVRRFRAGVRFRYFAAERGEWRRSWLSSAVVPEALGVITAVDDTLVYPVGPARD